MVIGVRMFLLGLFVYLSVTALIFSYNKITKKEFKHTIKLMFGAFITFVIIALLITMENF